jgi:putative ABC transport system permease protein
MAVGATPGAILRLVLAQVVPVIVVGSLAGIAISAAAANYVKPLLFELDAADPLTLAAGVTTLCMVTLVACYIPARRAMRINPVQALRHD